MKKEIANPEIRKLKTTLVLQLAVVVTPLIALLLMFSWQIGAAANRIDQAHQTAEKVDHALTQYKVFIDGVVDAVDVGELSKTALTALNDAAVATDELAVLASSPALSELRQNLQNQRESLGKDLSLKTLTPLRSSINASRKALTEIDASLKQTSSAEIETLVRSARIAQMASFALCGIGICVAVLFVLYLVNRLTTPLERAIHSCNRIAGGNLEVATIGEKVIDIGGLNGNLDAMREQFNEIMRDIEEAGKCMGQSAFQVAAISKEIAETGKLQESRSLLVNKAGEELSASSAEVEAHAVLAAERGQQLLAVADTSIRSVRHDIEEMGKAVEEVGHTSTGILAVNEAAEQIHQIIGTIKGIAGQTNLLALNAAIEAARAGEQGRGFAVVSDEVRNLAELTTRSAGEVSDIIGKLSGAVVHARQSMERVVKSVNENQRRANTTASDIEKLLQGISECARANADMADASRSQIQKMAQLRETMDQLFQALGESTAKVGTTARIGSSMYEITEHLNKLMAKFSLEAKKPPEAIGDKRRAARTQSNVRVDLILGGETIGVISRDLSMTGACLWLPRALPSHELLSLLVYLPSDNIDHYIDQRPISLVGKIMWQRQEGARYYCGIHFEQYSVEAGKKLQQCIDYYRDRVA